MNLVHGISPKWNSPSEGELYQLDALKLIGNLPNECVDLIITDPPYESLEKWRSTGTTTRLTKSKSSSNEWFDIFPNERFPLFFGHLFRVMKPGSHVYIFCDEETRDIITTGYSPQQSKQILPNSPLIGAGFKYWKSIVWNKVSQGLGYHYRNQHEFIIFAEKVIRKGKHKQLNDASVGSILTAKSLRGKKYYPTEKPASLIWQLIEQSSKEGEVILDPFVGSGTFCQLVKLMNRYFIAGDIKIDEALHRLENNVDLTL